MRSIRLIARCAPGGGALYDGLSLALRTTRVEQQTENCTAGAASEYFEHVHASFTINVMCNDKFECAWVSGL